MSAAHTPGPWQYSTNVGPTKAAIVEADGTSILDIHNRTHRGDEFEANARLIAAAPTMRHALAVVSNCVADDLGGVTLGSYEMGLVRAALAAAVQS